MAYSTEQIKTRMYQFLVNETEIKTKISGDVYKDRRPYKSDSEDVVINSLPADAGFLQQGTLNINCHVPYMKTVNVDEKVINHKRLSEISSLMLSLLGDTWTEMFNTKVEYHSLIEYQDECYYNFRIRINAFNKN